MSGILLAASPWIFSFADTVYIPHLIFGLLEIGASLMTKTQPEGNFGQSGATRTHAV
ncbi:MAG: SPW repeat protein [Segetibacter sp.]